MKFKKKLYEEFLENVVPRELARLKKEGVDTADAAAVVAACIDWQPYNSIRGRGLPVTAWRDDRASGRRYAVSIYVEWGDGFVFFAESDFFLKLLGIPRAEAEVSDDPALRKLAFREGATAEDAARLLAAWREGSE